MRSLLSVVCVLSMCASTFSHPPRPWIHSFRAYGPPILYSTLGIPLPPYPSQPFMFPNFGQFGYITDINKDQLQPVDVKYFEGTETVQQSGQVPQIPMIPWVNNGLSGVGNTLSLSATQNVPVKKEVSAVGNNNNKKYCTIQGSNCALGEQCVFADVRSGVFYACPNIPTVPCQCKPGCRFKNVYISFGQSVVVDKCGNKCKCANLYGSIDCDNKSC